MPTQATNFIRYVSDEIDLTDSSDYLIKAFGETEYNGNFWPIEAGLIIESIEGTPLSYPVVSIGDNAPNYNNIAAAQTLALLLSLELKGQLNPVSGYGGEIRTKITGAQPIPLGSLTMTGRVFAFGCLVPN